MKQKETTTAPQLPGLVAPLSACSRHSPAKAPACKSGWAPAPPEAHLLAGSVPPLPGLSPAPQNIGASPAAPRDVSLKGEEGQGQPLHYPGQGRQPTSPASAQWSRCAQMLGMLRDSWCGGGSQGEATMQELYLIPSWVMHCMNLSHPCSQ